MIPVKIKVIEDIKKEELDLIPTEYEVDEQEDKIIC